MAGADLLWENSIADWLVAGGLVASADLVWENTTAGWLADKPSEHSDIFLLNETALPHWRTASVRIPIGIFLSDSPS